MKKQAKKLALAKETLMSLEALRDVRGGSLSSLETSCSYRFCLPDSINDVC